jgi:AP-1-like factor
VEELEKVSAEATNENSHLKSKIDKLTVELNEYKKRVSGMSTSGSRSTTEHTRQNHVFGRSVIQNLEDVNFQFEFPKFGMLPGPSPTAGSGASHGSPYPSPTSTTNANSHSSPSFERLNDKASPNSPNGREGSAPVTKESLANFSGLFTSPSPYDSTHGTNNSRISLDSATFSLGGVNSASPSASSNSNGGPSSSCGTSPEPVTQSPLGFKPLDTLTTIGEEQSATTGASGLTDVGNVDFSNLDWLSQQNGGQFDPQLFGGYREPQESVLANTSFDDSFFNDALDVDFTTPFNMAPSPDLPKKNLIAEIDAKNDSDDAQINLLNCNNIWEKLQTCPKVASGDLDLDSLCSDLQKKAKCGGSGAVVDEKDFKTIMTKYLGPDAKCDSQLK